MIVAAGNRETDRANVYKISAPLANRFFHLSMVPNFHAWLKWAKGRVRNEIIQFLMIRPTLLFQMPKDSQKAFPSPRTWHFLSDFMNAFGYKSGQDISDEFSQVALGTIGEATGSEFLQHLKDFDLQQISDQVTEFIKTGKITLPKKISERYAIITAIFDAYKAKKITEQKYQVAFGQLNKEEQEAIKEYEQELNR